MRKRFVILIILLWIFWSTLNVFILQTLVSPLIHPNMILERSNLAGGIVVFLLIWGTMSSSYILLGCLFRR